MAAHARGGDIPKMFVEAPKLDGATDWEKFESLAKTVFSVRKDEIDTTKPVPPRTKSKKKKRTSR